MPLEPIEPAEEENNFKKLQEKIDWSLLQNRVIFIAGEIHMRFAEEVTKSLIYLWRKDNDPIYVLINSTGGEVYAGLLIYNTIRELVHKGVSVEVEARGLAASMGCIILQAGSKRTAAKETRLLMHEVSSIDFGTVSEVEDKAIELRKLNNMLRDIIAKRSKRTPEEIDKLWTKTDVWYSAEEALEFGLIDEIYSYGNDHNE